MRSIRRMLFLISFGRGTRLTAVVLAACLFLLQWPFFLRASSGTEEDTIPTLTRALGSADAVERINAAAGLGELGSKATKAVPSLLKHLKDSDPKVRREVILALHRIEHQKNLPTLIHALDVETDPDIRLLMIGLLREYGNEAHKGVPSLIATLKMDYKKYGDAIAEAQVTLISIGSPAVPSIIDLARDKNEKVLHRSRALYVLILMGSHAKGAVSDLAKLLSDPDDEICRYTIIALIAIGPDARDAIVALEKFSKRSRSMRRRIDAAEALYRINPDNKTSIPILLVAFREGSSAERARAAAVAEMMGSRARAAVLPLANVLKDPDEETRIWAARALGAMGQAAKDAVPALKEACHDRSQAVRKEVVSALKHIR